METIVSTSLARHSFGNTKVPKGVKLIKGDLRLLDFIGKGQFGTSFYRGATEKNGVVCVKLLRCQNPVLPVYNEYFNSELTILSTLKHENIVSCYGYDEKSLDGGVLERRLVFEFNVDNLHEMVSHRATCKQRLSSVEVRKYAIDIALALNYLHSRGICHRDINSTNIIMTQVEYPESADWMNQMTKHFRMGNSSKSVSWKRSKSVYEPSSREFLEFIGSMESSGPTYIAKISNFGIATDIAAMKTQPRVTAPAFSAPELFAEEMNCDESIDIWGLGCVIHEMLSKSAPLSNMPLSQIERLVTTRKFPGKASPAPSSYKVIETSMRRCLTFEPPLRPGASAVVSMLHSNK